MHAAAVASDGSEIPRPAASALISMRQPAPAPARPPITQSKGTKTLLPDVGPFWNACNPARCRRPICTPWVEAGISASVIPIDS